jgi:hypothetical protein
MYLKIKISRRANRRPTRAMFSRSDEFIYNSADGRIYGLREDEGGKSEVVDLFGEVVKEIIQTEVITELFVEPSPDYPVDILKYIRNGVITEVTSIPRPTGRLRGGDIIWLEDGYKFRMLPIEYFFLGPVLQRTESEDFEHEAPHPTLDRFDVYYVDNQKNAGIIAGIPGSGLIPSVDTETQLPLQAVLVKGGSTAPQINLMLVYDENEEWVVSSGGNLKINPEAEIFPFQGEKHIDISEVFSQATIEFSAPEPLALAGVQSQFMAVFLKERMTNQHNLYVSLLSGTTESSQIALPIQRDMEGGYQVLAITMSQFSWKASVTTFNGIRLRWTKSGPNIAHKGFYLDLIRLQAGDITPPPPSITEHNSLPGIQGGIPGQEAFHLTKQQHETVTRIGEDGNGKPTWNGEDWPGGAGIDDAPDNEHVYVRGSRSWIIGVTKQGFDALAEIVAELWQPETEGDGTKFLADDGEYKTAGGGLPDLDPDPSGTYGSSTKIPVATVDAKGRVTKVEEIEVDGAIQDAPDSDTYLRSLGQWVLGVTKTVFEDFTTWVENTIANLSHNSLTGIQGGTYHLTEEKYNAVNNIGESEAGAPLWNEQAWPETIKPFDSLTITAGATTWDTTTGLNKRVICGGDFTLTLTNLANGMSGALTIDCLAATTITLSTGKTNKGNGSLELTEGHFVLAFTFDDNIFYWNIAKYV